MDRYSARINLYGSTQREREKERLKLDILRKAPNSLSYKEVKINGVSSYLIINSGTQPYYKEFQSLPGQKILAGDYVEWANSMWLVYDADSDDEIYTDGNLRQCQHKIYWQKSDGTIIYRYSYTENASAYNNGETRNNNITLQSNQFMVYLPYDDETQDLKNGMRIHMSRSNKDCRPYDLTRPDDITYGFGEKGVLNIIFTQTQYNPDTDRLITLDNGQKVWICDYKEITTTPPPPDETAILTAVIDGIKEIKIGTHRRYTALIKDSNLNKVDWNTGGFKWNIISDFDVEQELYGYEIELAVKDESCIGRDFKLQILNNDDSILTEVTISVIDVW